MGEINNPIPMKPFLHFCTAACLAMTLTNCENGRDDDDDDHDHHRVVQPVQTTTTTTTEETTVRDPYGRVHTETRAY